MTPTGDDDDGGTRKLTQQSSTASTSCSRRCEGPEREAIECCVVCVACGRGLRVVPRASTEATGAVSASKEYLYCPC
jgi:hypothetical protein